MPEIRIREIDSTGAPENELNERVVLVIGMGVPNIALCKTVAELKAAAGGELAPTTDKGYRMAEELIKLGMEVLYCAVTTYLDVTDKRLAPFKDKSLYDIRFICCGSTDDTGAINAAMLKVAAARGDAIALCDIADSVASTIQTELDKIAAQASDLDEEDYKYGACFAPSVKIGEETFPGSFAYLSCFATHTSRFADWFAMAGSVRGVLPYSPITLGKSYGDADINLLQPRRIASSGDEVNSCNVIANIRPYGNIVWGNRTLLPVTATTGDGLRASHFLNIRNLCCDLKKALYNAARKFTFEPNSDVLWTNFCNEIRPLLEEMKSGQGIRGYEITKVESPVRATLTAKIRIIPIEAVEDFDLTVELTDSIEVIE